MNVRNLIVPAFILVIILTAWLALSGRLRPKLLEPEVSVIIDNDTRYDWEKEPLTINVPTGRRVPIKVQVSFAGDVLPVGSFSYQWCFSVNTSLNKQCQAPNFKGNVFLDYEPKRNEAETLQITVHDNPQFETTMIIIEFTPEE